MLREKLDHTRQHQIATYGTLDMVETRQGEKACVGQLCCTPLYEEVQWVLATGIKQAGHGHGRYDLRDVGPVVGHTGAKGLEIVATEALLRFGGGWRTEHLLYNSDPPLYPLL